MFFFLKITAHKVESSSLESTVFLASLLSLSLSLSLSTLEIHINSTNIYGWTFVKHQSDSDLGRNKMTLLLFANYF